MPNSGSFTLRSKSWWQRRTKVEKLLIGILIIALFFIIFLVVTVLNKLPGLKHVSGDVCLTKGCVKTAAEFLDNMNLAANPCEDFYEFACGKFADSHHIPEDRVSLSPFHVISDTIDQNFRTIIEEPVQSDELRSFKMVKKLYQICMNTSQIEKDGLPMFKKLLRDLGGWPVLEPSWSERNFDWKMTLYNLRKMGFAHNFLISAYVCVDDKNTTKRVFKIGQSGGGLTKLLTKGLNETIIQAYYKYMVDIATVFGADKNQASKEMMELLEFEMEHAKIMTPPEERRNASLEYNPMTIRDLQHKFPSIPWLQFINMRLDPYVTLTYDDVVIVTLPDYIKKIEQLLSVTSKRVLANYIFFMTIKYNADFLGEEFTKIGLKFSKVAYGITQDSPRWDTCISYSHSLYLAVSSMYVRRFFKENTKPLVSELVSDIKSSFLETLKKSTWMDNKTKKKAINKGESMGSYIGYPEELLDDEKIEEYYEGLEFHDNNYLKTSLILSIFYRNKYLKKFYEPYDKKDWKHKAYPTMVNAFYNNIENSIYIPTGIIQGLFFDPDRPQYLNFGSIGYVIGHEITHGFDDEGRQYDQEGNLVNWWEPSTNKTFQEKAQCIIDQYANYTNEKVNMSLNGINTQGENIADNGGIKMAYLGYQKWLSRNKQEQRLPGIKLNPYQLFWVSAANNWCSKVRPEIIKLQILNGYHSPNYYRTTIPFINSGFFAKDFNCPLGSRMNPKHKCRVW